MREWVVENGMKINPGKTKAVSFTRAPVKDPLNHSLLDQVIPEASSSKYLGIIPQSELSWTYQVNYRRKPAERQFISQFLILKKEIVIRNV